MKDSKVLENEAEKDPETLEREIDQTRAAMNKTLDSLERKLTPGQLLDECLRFVGKSGTEIGASLGRAVKENPIPVLLTATGIAWMVMSPGRRSHATVYDYTGDVDYAPENDEYEEFMSDEPGASDKPGALSRMADKVKSGASKARSQLGSSTHAIRDTVNSTSATVKDSVNRTTDSVKETFNRTTNLAQTQAKRAREGFNSLLEEQPLILGALGIALGAAIGAALPSTEQEDHLMGEARDKTLNKVKESGAQTFERARETVKKTAEDMRQSAAAEDTSSAVGANTSETRQHADS